ncbi:hypothetical protein [Saccharopolyspora griseoalba]|uniref:Uncharacterized protein n=1 Tax=Saccharopolyspora griseoalba TaxID=1431848 RepID=A0ABW2LRN3_9PSEU
MANRKTLKINGLTASDNLGFVQQQAALVERCRNTANNLPLREISDELHQITDQLREAENGMVLANVLAELRTWSSREDVSRVLKLS